MSPPVTPVCWKVLEWIVVKAGFAFEREQSVREFYVETGCLRPVVIPEYKEIDGDIILGDRCVPLECLETNISNISKNVSNPAL